MDKKQQTALTFEERKNRTTVAAFACLAALLQSELCNLINAQLSIHTLLRKLKLLNWARRRLT
jgi:hypothetical protein